MKIDSQTHLEFIYSRLERNTDGTLVVAAYYLKVKH